jgi:hypothetical protein
VRRIDGRQFVVGLREGSRKFSTGLGLEKKEDAEAIIAWLAAQGPHALELNGAELKQVERVRQNDAEELERFNALKKVFGAEEDEDEDEEQGKKEGPSAAEAAAEDEPKDVIKMEVFGRALNGLLWFRSFFVAGIVWKLGGALFFRGDPAFDKVTRWLGRPIWWAFTGCLVLYMVTMLRLFLPGLRRREIPPAWTKRLTVVGLVCGCLAAAGVGSALGGMFDGFFR